MGGSREIETLDLNTASSTWNLQPGWCDHKTWWPKRSNFLVRSEKQAKVKGKGGRRGGGGGRRQKRKVEMSFRVRFLNVDVFSSGL